MLIPHAFGDKYDIQFGCSEDAYWQVTQGGRSTLLGDMLLTCRAY